VSTSSLQRAEIVSAWDRDDNASAYQRFCFEFGYYPTASAALVAAARLERGECIGDLGCGTGVTSRAIVDTLGESASLCAVDPETAMLRLAQAASWPVGVRFSLGDLLTLRQLAPVGGYDCIVCASAAWLVPSRSALLAEVGRALRPGGRLALSIPSEFVGDAAHLLEESAQHFLRTLAQLRSELALAPPAPSTESPQSFTIESWRRDLAAAGLCRIERSTHPYRMSHVEWAAHLLLPAVLDGLLPHASPAAKVQFARRLLERIDPTFQTARPWTLLVAWKD
jgi:ubiquinone/menaquinone biosynthesis C-methylase UbiE